MADLVSNGAASGALLSQCPSIFYYTVIPNTAVKLATLLLYIQYVPGSNGGPKAVILTEPSCLCFFFWLTSCQLNQIILSTFFPIECLLTSLSKDTPQCELLKDMLNTFYEITNRCSYMQSILFHC